MSTRGGWGSGSSRRSIRHFRGQGFTLIELLVVISVIVLLMGILLPVLGRSREAARRTGCQSTLHQLHVAFTTYATDARDALPQIHTLAEQNESLDNWRRAIAMDLKRNYLGDSLSAFACPSRASFSEDGWDENTWNATWAPAPDSLRKTCYIAATSWRLNPASFPGHQRGGQNFELRRLDDAGESDRLLLADMTHWAGYVDIWLTNHRTANGRLSGAASSARITGGNLATLDGSVRWRAFADMQANYWWDSVSGSPIYW